MTPPTQALIMRHWNALPAEERALLLEAGERPGEEEGMIVERTGYEARHNGRRKLFATRRGALGRLAWWMIFDKYEPWVFHDYGAHGSQSEQILHPDCDCLPIIDGYGEITDELDPHTCPIHNRTTGYYRRLHDRFVRFWLKS